MADNVAITAGAGTTVATDQVPGTLEHYQKIKLADGTADSTTMATVTAGNALKVDGSAVTQPVSDAGGTLSVDDGGGSLTVDGAVTADTELTTADLDTGAGTDTRAVVGLVGAKSGGGVLIPGDATKGLAVDLTATGQNATALKVDGSAVTQPVSGSVTADTELTTADLDTGAGTDTRAVIGLVGAKSGGGALIPGDATKGLAVDLTATGANATAIKVDGSAVTQPVSAASLPLPTGASTAAKQPALGTAGTASADVITVQGIAAMTALKVDGSAVTQPVSVAAAVTVQGAAADDTAISGNPVPIGYKAASSSRTAVTAGDVVYPMANLQGHVISRQSLRELRGNQQTTITSSTAETTIVTADATYMLDLYGLILSNTSATATKVTIKDSTAGTTRAIIQVPAGDTRGFMLPSDCGHKQAAANNNWTATCGTSVADLVVTALYTKEL